MTLDIDANEAISKDQTDVEESEVVAAKEAPPKPWPPTEMLYMTYEGNFRTECRSTVLEVIPAYHITHTKDSSLLEFSLVLDQTVMHAQGGGQPTDTGEVVLRPDSNSQFIASPICTLPIDKVLIDRFTGIARHYGTLPYVPKDTPNDAATESSAMTMDDFIANGGIQVGATVQVVIDVERRQILSQCHTAGHVVDSAMVRCGFAMKPSKAYHFLDSPYVEYLGTIPESDRTTALQRLQMAFRELVEEDIETKIDLLSKEEADQLCNGETKTFDMDAFSNSYCSDTPPVVRVVTVAGYPCPCGGTHVRSTGELRTHQWGITGFKYKKGVIRVKYGQGVSL
jgi:Ser-tRNA(Ala) deacylase AlaX